MLAVEYFEDFEEDVLNSGQDGCTASNLDPGGKASDLDWGSASDNSNLEEHDTDSDSDQYNTLDYEN